MTLPIGLRLFRITNDVSYMELIHSFVKIEKPHETLTQIRTQVQRLDGRCQLLDANGVEIDGVIQVPQLQKVIAAWKTAELHSQRAMYSFLGLASVSIAWSIYCKAEVLKAVISLVVGFVSGFFAYQTYQIYSLARETFKDLVQTPETIQRVRQLILESGYSIFDRMSQEGGLKSASISAMTTTLHEQTLLFEEWVQTAPKDVYAAYDYLFARDGLLVVLKALEDESPYAFLSKISGIDKEYQPNQITETGARRTSVSQIIVTAFENAFGAYFKATFDSFNPEGGYLAVLQDRFGKYEGPDTSIVNHQQAIIRLWGKALQTKKLSTELEVEYLLAVCEYVFLTMFETVFAEQDAPQGYKAWLLVEISKLPDSYSNKQFLLSCLTEDPARCDGDS